MQSYQWLAFMADVAKPIPEDRPLEVEFQNMLRSGEQKRVPVLVDNEPYVVNLKDYTLWKDDPPLELGSVHRECRVPMPYDIETHIRRAQLEEYVKNGYSFRPAWNCGANETDPVELAKYAFYGSSDDEAACVQFFVHGSPNDRMNMKYGCQWLGDTPFQYSIDDPTKQRRIRLFAFKWQYNDPPQSPIQQKPMNDALFVADTWCDYSVEDSKQCERDYFAGKPSTTINIAGTVYVIDFIGMFQYVRNAPFRRRKIRREGSQIREEFRPDYTTLPIYPNHWPVEESTTQCFLPLDKVHYQELWSKIEKSMNCIVPHYDKKKIVLGNVPGTEKEATRYEIVGIDLNCNHQMFRKYFFYKKNTKKVFDPKLRDLFGDQQFGLCSESNEYYMFHGLPHIHVDPICQANFNFRLTSEDCMFGQGLYFADKPSKSNQYCDCPLCKNGTVSTKCPCTCKENTPNHIFRMLMCRVFYNNHLVVRAGEHQKLTDEGLLVTNPGPKAVSKFTAIVVEGGSWKANGRGQSLRYGESVFFGHEGNSSIYPEFLIKYRRVLS